MQNAVRAYESCYAAAPRLYTARLSLVLVDWSELLRSDSEVDPGLDALRRAVEIGEAALRDAPDADPGADLTRTLVRALGMLGRRLIGEEDLSGADRALQRAAELSAVAVAADPLQAIYLHETLGSLASARGDRAAAIEHFAKSVEATELWCRSEPSRPLPWEVLVRLHKHMAVEHSETGAHDAAMRWCRSAIAAGETHTARFPNDLMATATLAADLAFCAFVALQPGRRSYLAEAEAWARRGVVLLDGASDRIDRRLLLQQRCRNLARLGHVLDARGEMDSRDHWEATCEAMRAYESEFAVESDASFDFAMAHMRSAWHRFRDGLDAGAGEAMGRAAKLIAEHRRAPNLDELVADGRRLSAMLAARRGDRAGAAAAAERAHADRTAWAGAARWRPPTACAQRGARLPRRRRPRRPRIETARARSTRPSSASSMRASRRRPGTSGSSCRWVRRGSS
jgi:hypothetical protein